MEPTHDDIDKILDELTSSTRSPRGRFSASNSWKLLEKRINPSNKKRQLWRIASSIAASILLCLAGWYTYDKLWPAPMQTASTLAEIRTVTLPDQTQVTLNRYSTLYYPSRFKGRKRIVELKGEAYFEVEKDTLHPFIVKTNPVNIRVLGTHFNVEAYPGDTEVKTTLLEGSVAVSLRDESRQVVLSPNESAVYNRTEKKLQREMTPESSAEINWCGGNFIFDNLPLQEIARQLSHAFQVKIKITNTYLRSFRIRAHFTHNEGLEEILHLLQEAGNFNYTKTNDTIIISSK
ncbi:FecR family protein [Parabacteroides sp. AM08-6]|uniref:FecR family protein n=1 Tax=Parabacteroides sp. AM08-6 TaxID=2292053 RepID=UPI000EFF5976|nr:FecR family protein [Parabacteroides sp. AM08-6]RHJ84314.1 FecR family protein [Parabacteroides sp. AM08-6]